MNRYFVDKELYDNTEANFNDLSIRFEHLEKVADERMSTILDIEKYCIDEKEDLISGCEVCEDILKMIEELKNKNIYIKKTYTKRQIDIYEEKISKAINFIIEWCSISESTGKCICNLDKNKCTELLNILQGEDKDE